MGTTAGLIPFSEWTPDLTDLGTGQSPIITNVVPQGDGYAPFKDFSALTSALAGACRGYFRAINADGSITIFGCTSTRIYKLSNVDFTWSDVSKGGSAYSAVPSGYNWEFIQFNNFVIVAQVNTVLQVWDLTSSTVFADLAGSPPQAAYIAVIGRFIVLSGILSFPYRVQWSGLNATTTWDNVTAQSNYQDMADGGITRGIAGNDQSGVIFQDAAIRTMIFIPGAAYTFRITKIAANDGALNRGSIVTAGDMVYFVSPQGFKVIPPGGYPTPIGREKVDRTFFADLDASNLQYLLGATDPTHTRIFWAYKSNSGASGLFDTIMCYDRALQKFTKITMSGEYLTTLARPGLTLEGLNPIAPGALTITGAANNGAGLIRITVASTATLTTGQIVAILGVSGTTEANGNWTITVINATRFDLQGSTFSNAYVSGGVVGGSLDGLPFSLDDVALGSLAQLSMVNSSHVLGFFSGSNLEAIMETAEQDGQGRRVFISEVRPMTDSPDAACSIAGTSTQSSVKTYSTESTVNAIGACPMRVDTRFAKARLRIPAASVWTYARGVEPAFRPTGTR